MGVGSSVFEEKFSIRGDGQVSVMNTLSASDFIVTSAASILGSLSASAGAVVSKSNVSAGGNVLAVSTSMAGGTGYKLITVRFKGGFICSYFFLNIGEVY